MKISDLKINDPVIINGHHYRYQGVKKIRRVNFGTVEQIVFEGKIKGVFNYKYLELKCLSAELKLHDNGDIEFKGK